MQILVHDWKNNNTTWKNKAFYFYIFKLKQLQQSGESGDTLVHPRALLLHYFNYFFYYRYIKFIMGKGGQSQPPISSNLTRNYPPNSDPDTHIPTTTTSHNLRKIAPSFLATKTTVNECWIAYEGNVYDVTRWLPKHPGGIRSVSIRILIMLHY